MNARVRVKICGLTNQADAEAAIEAGADALGFNLFPGSKRYVDIQENFLWIGSLPPLVSRVAVLVNAPADEAAVAGSLLGMLQFHGDEPASDCVMLGKVRGWIKAFPLRGRDDFAKATSFSKAGAAAILVDAFVPSEFGGTGKLIDLPLAAELVQACPEVRMILSGGLTPENVAEAVRTVRPYAVDVASGVEVAGNPRRKDPARMRDFIASVRATSAS